MKAGLSVGRTGLAWNSCRPASQTSSLSCSQLRGVDLLLSRGKASSPPHLQHSRLASLQVPTRTVLR